MARWMMANGEVEAAKARPDRPGGGGLHGGGPRAGAAPGHQAGAGGQATLVLSVGTGQEGPEQGQLQPRWGAVGCLQVVIGR